LRFTKRACAILALATMLFPLAAIADRKAHAAGALAGEFETVIFAEKSLMDGFGRYRGISAREASHLRLPLANLGDAVDSLRKRTMRKLLNQSETILLGARDFQPPKRFGLVRSTWCYVVVLRNKSTLNLSTHFDTVPGAVAAGVPVWTWSASLGEYGEGDPRPSSLSAAQIESSYVLVCNSSGDLEAVARRLTTAGDSAENVKVIRDWNILSAYTIWAYRSLNHPRLAGKPGYLAEYATAGAEALIFCVDPEKKSATLMLFLSVPKDERTPAAIDAKYRLPKLQTTALGRWETKIPFRDDEESNERLFIIMGMFGFATFL